MNTNFQRLAEKSLGSTNLRQVVKLPEGEDLNEWLAYNGFYSYFFFYFYIIILIFSLLFY